MELINIQDAPLICPICKQKVSLVDGHERGGPFDDHRMCFYFRISCFSCGIEIKREFNCGHRLKSTVCKEIQDTWKRLSWS